MMELWSESVRQIADALAGRVRPVGGCVRDRLLGQPAGDTDLATPMRPKEVLDALKNAGIKAWPITMKRGVVMAKAGDETLEIATLRRDLFSPDGTEKTTFITDWQEDSARRDFTINALYLGADGTIYDYHGGQEDLAAGRVRFIGDPARRLWEDGLRILRYMRFWARFGRGEPDPAVVALFPETAGRLGLVSLNRREKEIQKILAGDKTDTILTILTKTGVMAHLSDVAALKTYGGF